MCAGTSRLHSVAAIGNQLSELLPPRARQAQNKTKVIGARQLQGALAGQRGDKGVM